MYQHYFEIVSDKPGLVKIRPKHFSAVRFPVSTARKMAKHINNVCDALEQFDNNVNAAVQTETDGGGI